MKESKLTSEERRDAIVAAAEDKKANYITALDLRGKTLIADFFMAVLGLAFLWRGWTGFSQKAPPYLSTTNQQESRRARSHNSF